jgi:hypothetical protein
MATVEYNLTLITDESDPESRAYEARVTIDAHVDRYGGLVYGDPYLAAFSAWSPDGDDLAIDPRVVVELCPDILLLIMREVGRMSGHLAYDATTAIEREREDSRYP